MWFVFARATSSTLADKALLSLPAICPGCPEQMLGASFWTPVFSPWNDRGRRSRRALLTGSLTPGRTSAVARFDAAKRSRDKLCEAHEVRCGVWTLPPPPGRAALGGGFGALTNGTRRSRRANRSPRADQVFKLSFRMFSGRRHKRCRWRDYGRPPGSSRMKLQRLPPFT